MRLLHVIGVRGAARLLLRKSEVCAERGFCEALLLPLVAAHAVMPKSANTLLHTDVQSMLAAFFKVELPHTTVCR